MDTVGMSDTTRNDISTITIEWAYYECIKKAFGGEKITLRLSTLPGAIQQDLIQEIQAEGTSDGIQVSMLDLMSRMKIDQYTIVTDNAQRSIKQLKREGVLSVFSVSDSGELCIHPIDGHFEILEKDKISRISLGASMKPYVLLYGRQSEQKSPSLWKIFSHRIFAVLNHK